MVLRARVETRARAALLPYYCMYRRMPSSRFSVLSSVALLRHGAGRTHACWRCLACGMGGAFWFAACVLRRLDQAGGILQFFLYFTTYLLSPYFGQEGTGTGCAARAAARAARVWRACHVHTSPASLPACRSRVPPPYLVPLLRPSSVLLPPSLPAGMETRLRCQRAARKSKARDAARATINAFLFVSPRAYTSILPINISLSLTLWFVSSIYIVCSQGSVDPNLSPFSACMLYLLSLYLRAVCGLLFPSLLHGSGRDGSAHFDGQTRRANFLFCYCMRAYIASSRLPPLLLCTFLTMYLTCKRHYALCMVCF